MKINLWTKSSIFTGSALLFCVQPMMGRTLQPLFGGSAAVWSVCLAAYQLLLLAGYWYAHGLVEQAHRAKGRGGSVSRGRFLHAGLLAAACVWLVVFAFMRGMLKGAALDSGSPAVKVLICVVAGVGLPYVLLSSGSTLIQAWLAESGVEDKRGVYRLYAFSNIGSILGLLIYPLLLEPFLSLQAQWLGFCVFLLLYSVSILMTAQSLKPAGSVDDGGCEEADAEDVHKGNLPSLLQGSWLWFVLPGLATFVLNAVTTYLSADVMPLPMLWVILLAAFLLSFVAGFSKPGEVALPIWCILAVLSGGFLLFAYWKGSTTDFLINMGAGTLFIFFACFFLTSWLYRIRPETRRLSRFYLGLAAGGAAGGVIASLVCPFVFNHVAELPVALVVIFILCGLFIKVLDHREMRGGLNAAVIIACVAGVLMTVGIWTHKRARIVGSWRNFYSVTVASIEPVFLERNGEHVGNEHRMFHGGTVHGLQVYYKDYEHKPTAYFGPVGGGSAILNHPSYDEKNPFPMNVGVLGLGIGTMAAWGREGDTYRFYEINPQVIDLACNTNYFTYISGCKADVELLEGDARKTLEREISEGLPPYDVLLLDAFSGDNLPIHLISLEAFELYLKRIKPDGILAVNTTNWHINMLPFCKTVAEHYGLKLTGIVSRKNNELYTADAMWVLMRKGEAVVPDLSAAPAALVDWDKVKTMRVPITDDRGCILSLIKFGMNPPVKRY